MQLSIIIVSYNEAEYLSDCFDSILKQNMDFDYEVIVGDDGSSDNSLEIIKEYGNKFNHFSYFVQEREPGLTKKNVIASIRASNVVFRAMNMAKGKYLNLVSGDDYFVDMNYFQRAIGFLEENKSYSAYLSSFYCVYPDGTKEYNDLRTEARFSFWHQQYIHCSCFVFRQLPKSTLLNSFCDDCGLQYSIALNGNLKYTNEYVFAYRQREKSIMHSNDREELDILEMLLFQDVLNKKIPSISKFYAWFCLYIISFRHFRGPFLTLYKKRGSLITEKYEKYAFYSKQYGNDVVSSLFNPTASKSKHLLKKINRWIAISDFVLNKFCKESFISEKNCTVSENTLSDFTRKNEKILYSIDYFTQKHRRTFIQGWAFVPYVVSEILIKVGDKIYKPVMYSRADVKEAYNHSCKNEGFSISIKEKFESFELYLVDRGNKCIYSQTVDNLLTKYVRSKEVSLIETNVQKDFPFAIDEKYFKHKQTYLRGWAYCENYDCEIFIEVDGKFYTTQPVRRSDVMRVFSLDNDNHGFTAVLPFKAKSFAICLVNHSKNELYKKIIER